MSGNTCAICGDTQHTQAVATVTCERELEGCQVRLSVLVCTCTHHDDEAVVRVRGAAIRGLRAALEHA